MKIFVKSFSGNTLKLKVESNMKILEVSQLILKKDNIPIDQQRLIFAGKQLGNDLTVGDYNIQDGATLHMVLRLRGGGFSFASLQNLEPVSFSDTAPNYRSVSPGLYLQGYCKNKNCQVYGDCFVCNIGFGIFDAEYLNSNCICPECYLQFDHVGVGFYMANIYVNGTKKSGEKINYEKIIENCQYEKNDGNTVWSELKIIVKKLSAINTFKKINDSD